VTIAGYEGDAMEPFLSRDGRYLFFNDSGGETEKDLFYATTVDASTFAFQGELGGVNTPAVDGAPTMDASGRFFYVSTHTYAPPNAYDTLFGGVFDAASGRVTGIAPLAGLADPTPGHANFDIEVSPDGATLYVNDGVFGSGAVPEEADLAVAVANGQGFARHPDSAALLANVNTADLEYAPAISADGLELFFTRFSSSRREILTCRATRPDDASPFGVAQRVSAISGFAEGATLSPDERSLYYHAEESGAFVLYRVTR
jgi:hypothetical protein